MFNISFTRKKPITPLSNLKSISSWMDNLSLRDVYEAHAEVSQKLAEFNESLDFTAERLKVLMFLDESSQDLQDSLRKQYLRNPRMSKSTENKLWEANRLFCWNMTKAYHGFVMDYVTHPEACAWTTSLHLVCARALYHFALEAKWHYYRYQAAEARMWKHMHNLYRFAEFQEFQNQPIKLYESSHATSTCASIYVRALMLEKLNTGALYPRQLELAEGWLAAWSDGMILESRYADDRHGFYVNLNEDRGAKRVRNYQRDPMKRYWSTKELTDTLLRQKSGLQSGDPQARIQLGEDCKLPSCLSLLDSVITAWAQEGVPRVPRKHNRVVTKKIVEIVHGFTEIHDCIKEDTDLLNGRREVPVSYEEMLDVKIYGFITRRTITRRTHPRPGGEIRPRRSERWIMENESEGGLGALIKEQANDWLRPGKLVALKVEKQSRWMIAVIRRLKRIQAEQFYVGVEVLSRAPLALELKEFPAERQVERAAVPPMRGPALPFYSLYIAKDEAANRGASLVMPSQEFLKGRALELATRNKAYRIALNEVIEKGDDWTRGSMEVLGVIT